MTQTFPETLPQSATESPVFPEALTAFPPGLAEGGAEGATLPVVRMGHPLLRRLALPVEDPTALEVAAFAKAMLLAMHQEGGVGLAAPQVALGRRLVVVDIPSVRSAAEGDAPATPLPQVLVNPSYQPEAEEWQLGWEGCLSVPGLRGMVPRYTRLRWQAFSLEGEAISGVAMGFAARVLQHEIDHLDGVLYLDRMPDLGLLTYKEELRHFTPEEIHAVLSRPRLGEAL